jgi:hypothetical protein
MSFPQYAVSRWIGHSIAISGKHYANSVPDELFDRAAQIAAHGASRNGSQEVASDSLSSGENDEIPQDSQEIAGARTSTHQQRVSDGIRTRDPEDHNLVL